MTALVLRETLPQPSPIATDRHHSAVELAEAKAKIRRTRQEVEEKAEQVAELKEELLAVHAQLDKVKKENMELVQVGFLFRWDADGLMTDSGCVGQRARQFKDLSDALDIAQERASKVERLEHELNRYKDVLNELDYTKARLEEVREDNRLLEEQKSMLDGQLESSRQREKLAEELNVEVLNYKSQVNNLQAEKEADKERIKKLLDDNAELELWRKNCLSESASLVAQLDSIRSQQSDLNNKSADSLGEQMTALQSFDLLAKSRRLEMENQRLLALLSNVKEVHFRENAERILQLEGENTRLKLKIEDVERQRDGRDAKVAADLLLVGVSASRAADVEKQKDELQRLNQEMKLTIETLKVSSHHQASSTISSTIPRSYDPVSIRIESTDLPNPFRAIFILYNKKKQQPDSSPLWSLLPRSFSERAAVKRDLKETLPPSPGGNSNEPDRTRYRLSTRCRVDKRSRWWPRKSDADVSGDSIKDRPIRLPIDDGAQERDLITNTTSTTPTTSSMSTS